MIQKATKKLTLWQLALAQSRLYFVGAAWQWIFFDVNPAPTEGASWPSIRNASWTPGWPGFRTLGLWQNNKKAEKGGAGYLFTRSIRNFCRTPTL